MREGDAIDVALDLTRKASPLRRSLPRPLPAKMLDVIKIATEHPETLEKYRLSKGVAGQLLLDSARLYLQKIILESGDDHHRALALGPNATSDEVRDHKRMLLKWLHPDRNRNSWESTLFLRVQRAADELEKIGKGAPVAPPQELQPIKKGGALKRSSRGKVAATARRRRGAIHNILRSAALPSLIIFGSAAIIYVAVSSGSSSDYAKSRIYSLLQWRSN